MKNCLRLSSAAVVMGAFRVTCAKKKKKMKNQACRCDKIHILSPEASKYVNKSDRWFVRFIVLDYIYGSNF